jgi:hypothetical protein
MTRNSTKTAILPRNTGKTRHNVCFSGTTRERGERLAELDRRSFSNLLEVLIDREYFRLFPDENGKVPGT